MSCHSSFTIASTQKEISNNNNNNYAYDVSPKKQQLQQSNNSNNLAAVLMIEQWQSIASQSGTCKTAGNYNINSNVVPIRQSAPAHLSGFGGLSVSGLCGGSAHGCHGIRVSLDATNSIPSHTSPSGTVTATAPATMLDVYKIDHTHKNNNSGNSSGGNISSGNDESINGDNLDNINININDIGGRRNSNIIENEEICASEEIKIENGNFDSSQCGVNNHRCSLLLFILLATENQKWCNIIESCGVLFSFNILSSI